MAVRWQTAEDYSSIVTCNHKLRLQVGWAVSRGGVGGAVSRGGLRGSPNDMIGTQGK